jgi:hypothetical protein
MIKASDKLKNSTRNIDIETHFQLNKNTEDNHNSDSSTGEITSSQSINNNIIIDPELENEVRRITAYIAEGSASGKDVALTQKDQLILQKHQELLLKQQQLKQKNFQEQNSVLNAKKLPNYRLLGRNIFEPNYKQQFLKKKIKTNTYYSRFIKQHPTNTLPLAFQKSANISDEKYINYSQEIDRHDNSRTSKTKKEKNDDSRSLSGNNESFLSSSDSNSSDSSLRMSKKQSVILKT